MIRGDERYWAEMVLDVINNVERPMLMYEGEKMIVRKALKAYIKNNDTADTPQTDCNGCRFVGTYDTEFPCANCVRKNKDYYDIPQTDCAWK